MPTIHNRTSNGVQLVMQESDVILYSAICGINGVFSLTALLGNFVALGAIWRSSSLHIPSKVRWSPARKCFFSDLPCLILASA